MPSRQFSLLVPSSAASKSRSRLGLHLVLGSRFMMKFHLSRVGLVPAIHPSEQSSGSGHPCVRKPPRPNMLLRGSGIRSLLFVPGRCDPTVYTPWGRGPWFLTLQLGLFWQPGLSPISFPDTQPPPQKDGWLGSSGVQTMKCCGTE
jgi:hypothetical protein